MSGLAVNASISEEPALLCFCNAWEESPMELDSWRLVSSIPRDWSNSGFPAAFLFERTQIVFWTFFHSWRNEEPYHLPPVLGSQLVWFLLRKKKSRKEGRKGDFMLYVALIWSSSRGAKTGGRRSGAARSAAARSAV